MKKKMKQECNCQHDHEVHEFRAKKFCDKILEIYDYMADSNVECSIETALEILKSSLDYECDLCTDECCDTCQRHHEYDDEKYEDPEKELDEWEDDEDEDEDQSELMFEQWADADVVHELHKTIYKEKSGSYNLYLNADLMTAIQKALKADPVNEALHLTEEAVIYPEDLNHYEENRMQILFNCETIKRWDYYQGKNCKQNGTNGIAYETVVDFSRTDKTAPVIYNGNDHRIHLKGFINRAYEASGYKLGHDKAGREAVDVTVKVLEMPGEVKLKVDIVG